FGDGSHPQNWAVVSDTGGKTEVLGNSFVGPTDCTKYGGPYCLYPWFSGGGAAFNYRVNYPDTVDNFRRGGQFPPKSTCPAEGGSAGRPGGEGTMKGGRAWGGHHRLSPPRLSAEDREVEVAVHAGAGARRVVRLDESTSRVEEPLCHVGVCARRSAEPCSSC